MSSTTSPDSDSDAETGWSTDNAAARLEQVQAMVAGEVDARSTLTDYALRDPDEDVRIAAISGLVDLVVLEKLRTADSPVRDAAQLQFFRVVSGNLTSQIPTQERLAILADLDLPSIKQVALLAKCKATGNAAVARIQNSQDLAELCLSAASVQVRKAAAQAITDLDVITKLLEQVRDRDKTVARVLSAHIPDKPSAGLPATTSEDTAQTLETAAALADLTKALSAHLPLLDSLSDPLAEGDLERLQAAGSGMPDGWDKLKVRSLGNLDPEQLKLFRLIRAVHQQAENLSGLAQIHQTLSGLNPKNTQKLIALRKQVRGLKSRIAWPSGSPISDGFRRLLDEEAKLDSLISENLNFQTSLLANAEPQIEVLRQTLDAGNSSEAENIWNRLNGILSNLSGDSHQQLRQKLAEFRPRIKELRDWKKFAATEKKKELIDQMQGLLNTELALPDRARQVNKMHESWKQLGYSSQNEKLWRDFKTLSDQAYAPCRDYFRQQKAKMAENLRERTRICEQLEQLLAGLDRENVQITHLRKTEDQASQEWKQYAPVEQARIKPLQKRFYGLLKQLRDIRRDAARDNGQRKRELVQQAQNLAGLEDRKQAMESAKTLQAQWKSLGPSFFKDDRTLWSDFRSACDAVFKERDAARKELKEAINSALQTCEQVLGSLTNILELDDEAFRESRKSLASLKRDFREALSPRLKKDRQQLLNRFESLVDNIESRYRRLPDRKTQQIRAALESRAAFCQALEDRLLQCNDDSAIKSVIDGIDLDAWQSLDTSGVQRFDQRIDERFKALTALTSRQALNRLTDSRLEAGRRLVVAAEIRADLGSPDKDSGLRMEIQLNQLQRNFGKSAFAGEADRSAYVTDLQLEFICLGPLADVLRQDFDARINRVADKLL